MMIETHRTSYKPMTLLPSLESKEKSSSNGGSVSWVLLPGEMKKNIWSQPLKSKPMKIPNERNGRVGKMKKAIKNCWLARSGFLPQDSRLKKKMMMMMKIGWWRGKNAGGELEIDIPKSSSSFRILEPGVQQNSGLNHGTTNYIPTTKTQPFSFFSKNLREVIFTNLYEKRFRKTSLCWWLMMMICK